MRSKLFQPALTKTIKSMIIFVMAFGPMVSDAEEATVYKVQQYDSLSQILYRLKIRPIYGKNQMLEKTLNLNPGKRANGGNYLKPGEEIWLPIEALDEAATRLLASARIEATATESVAANAAAAEASEVQHAFSIAIVDRFSQLEATDSVSGARANLYTSSQYGIELGLHQTWSPAIRSSFQFGLEKLNFSPSSNPTKNLSNDSLSKTSFTLGVHQAISPSFSLGYSLAYGSELFVRGLNSGSIAIEQKPLPSLGLSAQMRVIQKGQTALQLGAQGRYLFQGSTDGYEIKKGYSAGVFADLKYLSHHGQDYHLTLSYQLRKQDNSVAEQTESQISALISCGSWLFDQPPGAP